MTKQIQFDYTAPIKCTDEELTDFIKYQLGYGLIREDNPLFNYTFNSGKIDNLNIDGDDVMVNFDL